MTTKPEIESGNVAKIMTVSQGKTDNLFRTTSDVQLHALTKLGTKVPCTKLRFVCVRASISLPVQNGGSCLKLYKQYCSSYK